MDETTYIETQHKGESKMFSTYTRPSGKQFAIIQVLSTGPTKSWVVYKDGKSIVHQSVWNKHLA